MTSTGNPGGKQWRFEAIDLRAGMAIALWRDARSTGSGLPPDHAPGLFFSPPHFQPEPIVNTAVALAACRGTFEPGLYVDEAGQTEASFAAPEDVMEFLRRAYIGGAGGDGGDGGGGGEVGPVPPPPEDGQDGPDLPSSDNHDRSMVGNLSARILKFLELSEGISPGATRSFSWEEELIQDQASHPRSPSADDSDTISLGIAAIALIAELLRRQPTDGDTRAWSQWYNDVRELTSLLLSLGAVEVLLVDPCRSSIESVLLRSRLNVFGEMPDDEQCRLLWLFLFGPIIRDTYSVYDHLLSLRYELDYRYHRSLEMWAGGTFARVEDPLDALARLPLPISLHPMLPEDVRETGSVYHLLNLIVSEPQILCRNPSMMRLALCIGLFAASCIASTRAIVHESGVMVFHRSNGNHERARRTFEQGHAWLMEHLPRTVYAQTYEAIIGRAKSLRYCMSTDGIGRSAL